jgi:hypothetical protein
MLYSAAARAGKDLGYERIQTYILDGVEDGTSLKASGWMHEGTAGGGQWKHTDGKVRRTDQPTSLKQRWARTLNVPQPDVIAEKYKKPPRLCNVDFMAGQGCVLPPGHEAGHRG